MLNLEFPNVEIHCSSFPPHRQASLNKLPPSMNGLLPPWRMASSLDKRPLLDEWPPPDKRHPPSMDGLPPSINGLLSTNGLPSTASSLNKQPLDKWPFSTNGLSQQTASLSTNGLLPTKGLLTNSLHVLCMLGRTPSSTNSLLHVDVCWYSHG